MWGCHSVRYGKVYCGLVEIWTRETLLRVFSANLISLSFFLICFVLLLLFSHFLILLVVLVHHGSFNYWFHFSSYRLQSNSFIIIMNVTIRVSICLFTSPVYCILRYYYFSFSKIKLKMNVFLLFFILFPFSLKKNSCLNTRIIKLKKYFS